MAKLRNVQFYRNGQASVVTNEGGQIGGQPYLVNDLKSAYVYAEALFKQTGKHNEMEDGEILLYRFSYNGTVHTLVGVVHVSGEVHSLEVLANYDMLGAEISNEIAAAIKALDATVTDSNEKNDITVKVTQTDGILTAVEVTDSLAEVAHTGAAANVSIADTEGVIEATTVEGALAEIAKEIDAMDYNVSDVEGFQPTAQGEKVKVTIQQKDGKITNVAVDETALENALDKLKADTTLKIDDGEKVLSQNGNGLKSTLNLTYDSTDKTIKLWGISTTDPIATVDATDFIKDGMLADATIVSGTWEEGEFTESETGAEKAIKFVWKTYQQGQTGQEEKEVLKTEYLNVESLVDAYTAGNEWVVINPNTNEISHKTQTGLPTTAQGIVDAVNVTGKYAETKTFKVPQLTVDTAGHVTAVTEKEVSITLPTLQTAAEVAVTANQTLGLTSTNVQSALEELQGDINAINAVNWNGDGDTIEGVEGAGEIIVNDTTHTISHKQHTLQTTASTNATAVKSVVIPQLTINDYGHVTAIDNKTFEIDFNVPTVSGTEGQIVVTPTPAEGTEDINYTVGLAKVVTGEATNVAPTESTDDYVANKGTTEAPKNEHTRVENITVDAYGRVTAYTLTTVEENWDCGIW